MRAKQGDGATIRSRNRDAERAGRRGLRFVLSVLAVAMCIPAGPAAAAWPEDPSLNFPVAVGPGWQVFPSLAPDGDGGWFVVWMDTRNGGDSDYDIYRAAESMPSA